MKTSIILTLALVATSFAAFAQTNTNCAPVDGGLSFLLVAGAASYGAKKIAEKKKQKSEKSETVEK